MSQFERGSPLYGTRWSGVVAPSSVQTQNLIAPGLAEPVINSTAARQSFELLEGLGMAGRAIEAAGRYAQQQQAIVAAQEDEARRKTDAEQAAMRGSGVQAANLQLPQILDDIETGKLDAGDEDALHFAVRIANQNSDGFGTDYADGYLKAAGPDIAAAVLRKRRNDRKIARDQSVQRMADAASVATDADGVAQAISGAMELGLTEDEAYARVGLKALDRAAKAGDREAFDRVNAVMGDRFAEERAGMQYTLDNRVQERTREAQRAKNDEITGLINDGAPDKIVGDRVEAARKAGQITEEQAQGHINYLKAKRAREAEEARKVAEARQEDDWRTNLLAEDTRLAAEGVLDFVNGKPLGDATVEIGGRTVRVSAADRMRAGINNAFANVDAMFPLDTAAPQNWAEKVRIGRANNALPDSLVHPIAAGSHAAGSIDIRNPDSPELAEAVAGVNAYTEIASRDPLYAARLAAGTPDAERFYDTVDIARKYLVPNNDPRQAVLIARRQLLAAQQGRAESSRLSETESVEYFPFPDAANASALRSEFADLVAAQVSTTGIPRATALERAKDIFESRYVDSNGFKVYALEAEPMREAIQTHAPNIVQEWVKRHPNSGYEADDLALAPDGAGNFIIVDGTTGVMVPTDPDERLPVFSRGEVLVFAHEKNAQKRADIEAMESEQNRRRGTPFGVMPARAAFYDKYGRPLPGSNP